MNTCSTGTHEIGCGVPQVSNLGPLLFNLYMFPLLDVIRRHGIGFHSYATFAAQCARPQRWRFLNPQCLAMSPYCQ